MSIKELVADCVEKMKGPSWGYFLHPRSVESDLGHFLQSEWDKKPQSEEKTELERLNRRFAYSRTLPGVLKEYFPKYLKKIYLGEGIDSDRGTVNFRDAKGEFTDFGVEFTPPNVNLFLTTLSSEFSNIPDGEMLKLLKTD